MMLLVLLLQIGLSQTGLLQTAPTAPPQTPGIAPGVLPKQDLPAKGCAAYLWSAADRSLIAMARADPSALRVSVGDKVVDLARTSESGAADYGFSAVTGYAGGEITAALDMTITRRADLASGAMVPTGTLTIARAGGDSVVVPVAGLIGCAP